jgi:hypothetical protein
MGGPEGGHSRAFQCEWPGVGGVKEGRAGVGTENGTEAEGRAGVGRGNGMRAEGHASAGRGGLCEGDARDMRTREGRTGKGRLRTREGGRTEKGQGAPGCQRGRRTRITLGVLI